MAGVRNGIQYSEEYMGYKYHLEWDVYGQDEQGRKIVRWKLVSDSSGSYSRMSMHLGAYDANGSSLKIEGISNWKSAYSSGEIIDSGDFICPLDTYQIAIEGYCYINAGIGLSIAGVWELTTEYIPSPSTIACSTAAIGQAPTIAITKKDVDTYVTITYTFGTLTGTVVEGYAGAAYTGWIIPDTFYNEMTDVSSKKGTMTAVSYRNGVMTGSESCQFTVKVDADECAPTITATVVDSNATTTAITQDNTFFIKGYSDATITVNATANMGASIASYYINNNGRVATSRSATFNGVTSGNFVITVTDSRGVSATTTVNISLIDYTRVSCAVSATPPTTEGKTTITVSGSYFPRALGYTTNTLSVKYRRWRHGDGINENWMDVSPTLNNGAYEAELPFSDLDYKSAYTFEAVATDLLSQESSSISIKTVPVFSWGNDDFEFNVPVNVVGELECDELTVVGPSNLNGTNEIEGTTEIKGTLTVGAATDFTGTLGIKSMTASGDISCDDLTTAGKATIGTDLTVTDKVTAARIQVTGDADFDSGIKFNAGVEVRGASEFKDALTVNKLLTVTDSISVEDDATIGGTLDVTESLTVGEGASITGDTSVTGDLTVSKGASIAGDLSVTGTINGKWPFGDYVTEFNYKYVDTHDVWNWYYRKWSSGLIEMWGSSAPIVYGSADDFEYISCNFPFTLRDDTYVITANLTSQYGHYAIGSTITGSTAKCDLYEASSDGSLPRKTTGTTFRISTDYPVVRSYIQVYVVGRI